MAQTRSEIKEIVEKYRAQLVGLGIRPVQVYLFGSYARGTASEGSDIDLIVVSPDFSNLNLRERLEVLGVAAARLLRPIQAVGYTPEEMIAKSYTPFLEEILAAEAVTI